MPSNIIFGAAVALVVKAVALNTYDHFTVEAAGVPLSVCLMFIKLSVATASDPDHEPVRAAAAIVTVGVCVTPFNLRSIVLVVAPPGATDKSTLSPFTV